MSASKTNLEKQKRRHRGPLIGIAVALAAALILFLVYILTLADTETPEPAAEPAFEESEGLEAPASPVAPDGVQSDQDIELLEPQPTPGD